MPRSLLFAAALLTVSVPATVGAQGFPIGEKSKIHTKLDIGAAFDSNPERFSTATSEWRGTLRPGLSVDVPGESLMLKLGGQFAMDYYFGRQIENSQAFFGGDIGLDFRAGSTRSVVGLEVRNHLTRTPTFFPDVGTVGSAELRFQQWYNIGAANVVLRPGGGALEFRLGYTNRLSIFDDLPQSQQHGAAFEAKLKFLPKTAAVFNADLSFFSADASAPGDPATLNSAPYNITLGLLGQFTEFLSAEAAAGFGDSLTFDGDFFSNVTPTNIRTLIARVNATFSFLEQSSITIGYDRRIQPIIQLNSYVTDAAQLMFRLGIGPRLALRGMGRYEYRAFQDGRNAHVGTVDGRIEYWFFEFLNASLVYQMLIQEPEETGVAAGNRLLEQFTRHQVMLTTGFRY